VAIDTYELSLAVVGLAALLAAWLPAFLDDRALSLPIILVGIGAVVFAVPSPLQAPDPRLHLELTERIAEVGVLVALVGAGLSIDRPIGWRRWRATWRLLLVALPAGVVVTAVVGWWWLGLVPASALLLGAVLAPTDPVLAADVQVGEPTVDGDRDEVVAEDEVRVTLTSEAGLNDGLAFPFVYAAVAIAASGTSPGGWVGRWIVVDVGYRIVAGVVVGVAIGWLLGRITFRPPGRTSSLADASEGFVGIAAMFLSYGAAEVAHGYGFVAVFLAAVTLRSGERGHPYHQVLHGFTSQVERLVIVVLLMLFGGALVGGLLDAVTWPAVAVALTVILVIRPLTARISLIGIRVTHAERATISFFGIRGIASLYYMAVALRSEPFPGAELLWSTVALTVAMSIVIHGVAATPVLRVLDRRRARRHAAADTLRDRRRFLDSSAHV